MKNIYLHLLDHQSDKSNLALATVTSAHGSTPQKPGSSALFDRGTLICGTVGGGVVENRVEKLAKDADISGKSGYFRFNLDNDISEKEEAICGGRIEILLDADPFNHISVFQQLRESVEKRVPGVLITMVTKFTDDTVLINRYWATTALKPEMPASFSEKINPVINEMLSGNNPSDYRETELDIPGEEPSSKFFLEAIFPAPRLIIAGAGHIGRTLAQLADMIGFDVTIIDDRQQYANPRKIPEGSHFIVGDIGQEIYNLQKSDDTYAVIVTRGHKDDAEALKACINSGFAYTGMIGSKTKIAAMKSDFITHGWATPRQWDSIYTPIGLDIRSKTVEEIAISIAAQLILVKNSR
jgi:xanthine dehydrogenase accessory factor